MNLKFVAQLSEKAPFRHLLNALFVFGFQATEKNTILNAGRKLESGR